MINLTLPQRDFLDRFYTEYLGFEFGPVTKLAADHGFYYEHFLALFGSYQRAWGKDWGKGWEGMVPSISDSSQHMTFPWESVKSLEDQFKKDGLHFVSIPRKEK